MSNVDSGDTVVGIKASFIATMDHSPARVIAPILCDDMCYSPPAGLLVGGFPWAARAAGGGWEIDENLIDTVVAWSALGNSAKTPEEKIECVLEIAYGDDVPAEDLIHLAASGEFSLALVGLDAEASTEEVGRYALRLKELALAMLAASNYSKSLYPFSNEFEAFFLERLGKEEDAFKARSNWSKGLVDVRHPSGARVEYALKRTALGRDEVRRACQDALVEHFGSQEMVDAAIRSLARPIAKRIEGFADEIKAQPKAKQDRFDLSAGAAS